MRHAPDAMSIAEAKAYDHAARWGQAKERIEREYQSSQAITAAMRKESLRLRDEMVKAGTAAHVAEMNAVLFTEYARAYADRYGLDPVAEMKRITVERGKPGEGGTYFHAEQIRLADEALRLDSEAWGKSVDSFIGGSLPARRSVTMLNQTPLVLQMLGAKNLPVNTTYGTLKKVLVDKHKLPAETVKQVPAAMADPVMVFQSATQAGDLVMMLELKDQHGATVVVPVALEQTTPEGYTVNLATSVYAKGSLETGRPNNQWFAKQIQDGNLLYQNKEKSRAWAAMVGLQLPPTHRSGSARNTVHTEADLVKLREANPTMYQRGARGAVELSPERAAIRLFEKADLSTIPHESAHIFLDTLMRVVADDGGHARALYESRLAEGMDQAKAQKIYDSHMAGIEQAKADLRTLREFAEAERINMPGQEEGKRLASADGEGEQGQARQEDS